MKKILSFLLMLALSLCGLVACKNDNTLLDPDNPVTLTMWHVYGEQADSPMNKYIEEFNRTVGKEKGIIINVTMMSNASQIGDKLVEAQADKPGAPDMPDLFFCHNNNAALLGTENLIDWKDMFTSEELSVYVDDFIADGYVGDELCVFPVSKSTHLLYIAGGVFERFCADTGVSYDDLSSWDGFFNVAEKYYVWSDGKPFCAIDYLLRCVELNAMSKGATSESFYTENGWYDFNNELMKASYMEFAESIAKGHIVIADLYSNTQVMTGETIAGIGSSASVLYYNDTITYPDNTNEPMNLQVCPLPQAGVGSNYATQAGVGLCAYKTTEEKAEAATVFVRWFTEAQRNFDFVISTGYMPVHDGAFDKIQNHEFTKPSYENLYAALGETKQTCTLVSEPSFANYYTKVNALYASLRALQNDLLTKYANGANAESIATEIWTTFEAIE